jgi:hypothetical protein
MRPVPYAVGIADAAVLWGAIRPWLLHHLLEPSTSPATAITDAFAINLLCLGLVGGIVWGTHAWVDRRPKPAGRSVR